MNDIAKKIAVAMNEQSISYGELANMTGIPKSALFRYATGQTGKMPLPRLEQIAKALHLDPAYLMGWDEQPQPAPAPSVREIDPIYDALNDAGQKELCRYGRYLGTQEEYKADEREGKILSFGTIPHFLTAAAAGYVAPVEGQDFELVERDANTPAGADFCIDIDGDSMEPWIHDGQRVYVKRDTTDLREFDVGIFYVDGDVLCKQWCRDYAGTLHLLSANPKREDANRQIHRSAASTVICFGKVLLPRKLPRPEYRR